MSYSYDPTKIGESGVDRMRFELGDTQFNPAELTAALADEEYSAVISANEGWKKAKFKCLEAILMKFAHQTDMRSGPVSYDFSERVKFWKDMYDDMKGSVSANTAPLIFGGCASGEMYFHEDMQRNPRRYGP